MVQAVGDDAAAYNLGNDTSILSTTDFFMPIVDDPYTFGKIAATNAISEWFKKKSDTSEHTLVFHDEHGVGTFGLVLSLLRESF